LKVKNCVVVDYGFGNIYSVCNALSYIGVNVFRTAKPAEILDSDYVILPGVGSFYRAQESLKKRGIEDALKFFLEKERPFLGICLGMQLMMDGSDEDRPSAGLGYIPGTVSRIRSKHSEKKLKLPHIGWSPVFLNNDFSNELMLLDRELETDYYFVHSYMCCPDSSEHIYGDTVYGGVRFPAIIGRGNALGVQFHPERSGKNGLQFLVNFFQGIGNGS